MAGVSSISGGASMSASQIQNARTVAAVKLQKDAVDFQGDMAMKLLQSVSSDPAVGRNLNVKA